MFDIGFFELLVIAIVGLVVVGPERLPEAARAVGLWIGRLKRSLRDTRGELERQLGADDIRRQLHNEEVMRSLEATRQQVQDAISEDPAPHRQHREESERPGHPSAQADEAGSGHQGEPTTDSPEPGAKPRSPQSDDTDSSVS